MLRRRRLHQPPSRDLVGASPAIKQVRRLARSLGATNDPVLITGEPGTGKELVARLLHAESDRRDGSFIPVNCGAVPASLAESEFFGHVTGAFSGADRDKAGLFERADERTLFLDEVGELSTQLQVKLLRVLDEGEMRRVGDTEVRFVDVRIVAATNRRLDGGGREGRMRKDFLSRIAVHRLHLPPLRERREDIPLLARYFLGQAPISSEAVEVLVGYPWRTANVRELRSTLRRAEVLAGGRRSSRSTSSVRSFCRAGFPDQRPRTPERLPGALRTWSERTFSGCWTRRTGT